MRQKDVLKEVDAIEILENLAYDRLQNKEFKDKMHFELSLEEQQNQTKIEEEKRILTLFIQLGLQNPPR